MERTPQSPAELIDEAIFDRLLEVIRFGLIEGRCLPSDIPAQVVEACASGSTVYDAVKCVLEKRLEMYSRFGGFHREVGLRRIMSRLDFDDLGMVARHLIVNQQVHVSDLFGGDYAKCPSLLSRFIDFCMDPSAERAPTDLNIVAALLLARNKSRVFGEIMKLFGDMGLALGDV